MDDHDYVPTIGILCACGKQVFHEEHYRGSRAVAADQYRSWRSIQQQPFGGYRHRLCGRCDIAVDVGRSVCVACGLAMEIRQGDRVAIQASPQAGPQAGRAGVVVGVNDLARSCLVRLGDGSPAHAFEDVLVFEEYLVKTFGSEGAPVMEERGVPTFATQQEADEWLEQEYRRKNPDALPTFASQREADEWLAARERAAVIKDHFDVHGLSAEDIYKQEYLSVYQSLTRDQRYIQEQHQQYVLNSTNFVVGRSV